MLYVNRSDGAVLTFDLGREDGVRKWVSCLEDSRFLETVRGVALALDGHRADLPLPRRFREISFDAEVVRGKDGEIVAERVSAVTDVAVLTLTMYVNGRTGRFRIDLDRCGRRRFAPA